MVGLGFLALGGIGVASHGAEFPSLLVAMLARDEELLLKKHLPAWKQVGDSFLLGLDSRTQDDSAAVALSLLAPKPLQVYHFDFDGFGSAKSKLLQESYVKFPGMAYVLVVEPDMLPKGAPFSREPLRSQEPVYAVRRGGKESLGERLTDCVFRNDGNWYFRFRVHETPVYRNAGERGLPDEIKDTGWSVLELEGSSRDRASRQERIREELRLVRLDLKDHPGHPRLMYYLGVLQYDLAMELSSGGSSSEVRQLAAEAQKTLARRTRDSGPEGSQEGRQQRSAAAYFCARTYLDLFSDEKKGEKWLKRTISLEEDFLYARVALIQLLFRQQRHLEAYKEAVASESLDPPKLRLFMDSGPLHACDLPLLLSKAMYYMYADAALRPRLLRDGTWHRREILLETCAARCPAVAGDSLARKMQDITKLKEFWSSELRDEL